MPKNDHEAIAEAGGDGSAGGISPSTQVSATGQYLKPMLERASVKPLVVDRQPTRPKRARKGCRLKLASLTVLPPIQRES